MMDNTKAARGFWPQAKIRIPIEPYKRKGKGWPICAVCGRKTHPDRITYQNFLPVCRDCGELP